MEAFEEVFGTCAPLDFRSYQESAGVEDADAACAGFVDETSKEIGWPLAAVARLMGAVGRAIVEAQVQMGKGCSTWKVPSGWVAVHKSVCHAGRAVVIEQKLASLTVEYGRKLGDIPRDSSSRPP